MKNFTQIIDISWPLSIHITGYKNRGIMTVQYTKNWEFDNARESFLQIGSHTGTHLDAPSHFIADGNTIETLPLSKLVGKCIVFDLSHCNEKITVMDLEKLPITENDIVLCKTKNSDLSPTAAFNSSFIYIAEDAAHYLATKKISTIGFDYLGIERNQQGAPSHKIFFNNSITIIEGLRLAHVNQGTYFLCCLPLALQNIEAAPARAILLL